MTAAKKLRAILTEPSETRAIDGASEVVAGQSVGPELSLVPPAPQASSLGVSLQGQMTDSRGLPDQELSIFYKQFEQNPFQCFWIFDQLAKKPSFVCSNFQQVFGLPPEVALGQSENIDSFLAYAHIDDKDHANSQFHTSLAKGENPNLEFRVVTSEGELRWLWVRCYAFQKNDHGNRDSGKIVFFADDITEKKQQMEMIKAREMQMAARAKMTAMGELAAGVAHEVNGPLMVLFGKIFELQSVIEENKIEIPELKSIATKIETTTKRVADVMKSMSTLHKTEQIQNAAACSVLDVAAEVVAFVDERCKRHAIDLRISSSDAKVRAEFHRTQISQVLMILINNAIDAISDLKEKWIEIDFFEDEDSIYLTVTDSGFGIPIRNRSKIFDPFFTTKPADKGTGLGLALAQGIVAHHNGSLRLDFRHARTRFVVQLPKKQK